jgi:3-hydroxybutyryl-CoA dehydratase
MGVEDGEVEAAEACGMVQALLTATLPTRIGGDPSFIARSMMFEFVRPAFTGDHVQVEMEVLSMDLEGDRHWAELRFTCRNHVDMDVLVGNVRGFVLAENQVVPQGL